MTEIYDIRLGEARVYLIKGQKGYVLVDAGSKGKEQILFSHLDKLGISSEDIKLVIITHVHYDHVGSLAVIKEMSKCQVAVHTSEARLPEDAIITTPPLTTALGRLLFFVGHKFISIDRSFTPVKPDILISELRNYCIHSARISPDSIMSVGIPSIFLGMMSCFLSFPSGFFSIT